MDVRLLLRCLLCLASTAAALGQTSPICRSRRYQLNPSNSTTRYCYLYVASPAESYAAANRSCIRDGAILLSILSADEDTYIRDNFFTTNGNQEFWIGLNDVLEEGTFRWENSSGGQPLLGDMYSNWSPDFPRDNRASLDCVVFSSDGWRVHDLPCGSSRLPFVCKTNTCESNDGEICLDSLITVAPAPLVSPGGISAIVIVVVVVIAVLIILVIMFFMWKFKNDHFNRLCCWCCGGAERSKVRNLQQENQRLRQQLSQHRLSVSGRMPPGQFTNAISGVPDGRGGMLPAIKQPISPMDDRPTPFLSSPVGGGPPPLSIQRQTMTAPGPLIGGRPPLTTPSGPLPRSIFTGSTPIRPVRQSAPIFSGGAPPILPQMSKPGSSNGTRAGAVATEAVLEEEEEEETESSRESEEDEGAEPKPEGAGSKQDDADKDSQQE